LLKLPRVGGALFVAGVVGAAVVVPDKTAYLIKSS